MDAPVKQQRFCKLIGCVDTRQHPDAERIIFQPQRENLTFSIHYGESYNQQMMNYYRVLAWNDFSKTSKQGQRMLKTEGHLTFYNEFYAIAQSYATVYSRFQGKYMTKKGQKLVTKLENIIKYQDFSKYNEEYAMIRRTSTILSVTQRLTYTQVAEDLFSRSLELVLQQIKQDVVDL